MKEGRGRARISIFCSRAPFHVNRRPPIRPHLSKILQTPRIAISISHMNIQGHIQSLAGILWDGVSGEENDKVYLTLLGGTVMKQPAQTRSTFTMICVFLFFCLLPHHAYLNFIGHTHSQVPCVLSFPFIVRNEVFPISKDQGINCIRRSTVSCYF